MKGFLMLFLACVGCATKEVVRIQKVPVRHIDTIEKIIVIPVPVPMKPPTMQRPPSDYWA